MFNPNQSERRILKKGNKNYLNLVSRPETTTTKNIIRAATTHEQAEADNINAKIDNAPVVHGSFEGFFEITKTDADIAHTKVVPTKAYSTSSTLAAKAVTPHFLRVKNKKPAIEKVNLKKQQQETTTTTARPTTTTTKTTTSTTKTSTTLRTTKAATTTPKATVTTTISENPKREEILEKNPLVQNTVTTTTTTTTMMSTTKIPTTKGFFNHIHHLTLPPLITSTKLPSFPLLDTQPWRPIHREELLPGPPPAFPTKTIAFSEDKVLDNVSENLYNKLANITHTELMEKSSDSNYQFNYSFNRFGHLPYTDIERLGAGAQIQPHPLPISLIDEVMPSFKPIINDKSESSPITSTENSKAEVKLIENNKKDDIIEYNTTPIEKLQIMETSSEKVMAFDENILSKSNNNVLIESQQDSENITINTTKKPYVWNMREVILKRNQVKPKNNTDMHEDPNSIVSSNQQNSTVSKNKISMTLDDSFLFPSHSKWQFVNSSANHYNHYNNYSTMSNLRKVFNKTLQALVSEDINDSENLTTLNEIKTRINNITNLQDISHIFDTLASKLGVTPSISTKLPPVSHNKFKQQTTLEKIDNLNKSKAAAAAAAEEEKEAEDFSKPTVSSFIELQQREELHDENSSSVEGIGAAIPVFGEAEIEHMDPTKYEELLRSTNFAETSSRESLPELVTLLPVRSNSAVRSRSI